MEHWDDVQEIIAGYPVRRVWEIYNKMLIDREKFILGNSFGWIGYGFLLRVGTGGRVLHYQDFVERLQYTMDYCYGLYPPYPAESGLPLLNSFSNVLQYGSRKYPELHKSVALESHSRVPPLLSEYKPEEFYKTAAAGGDDDYAFINQNQLFEKLWNLLHYFGGVCISQRGDGIAFWEDSNGSHSSGSTYAAGSGIRFFYTPADNLEYKYLCIAAVPGSDYDRSYSGIVQNRGRNILYESNWTSGAFTSPWLAQTASQEHDLVVFAPHLFVYPHFPDFYDPDTLEPMYF